MKVYISTDMEGIAGVREKSDVRPGKRNYRKFAKIQTEELSMICQLLGKGATVTIRDAHSEGTNVLPQKLPRNAQLIQNFNGDIWNMMSGLEKGGYDFAILHGYHAKGGCLGNPLAHSFSSRKINHFMLNGEYIGETGFAVYKAAYLGTPVCYVTGDSDAIAEANQLNKNIIGTETKRFMKNEVIILPQNEVLEQIGADLPKAAEAFENDKAKFMVELPKEFDLRIRYNSAEDGNKYANFPGTEKIDEFEIRYRARNFVDLLKMMIVCR